MTPEGSADGLHTSRVLCVLSFLPWRAFFAPILGLAKDSWEAGCGIASLHKLLDAVAAQSASTPAEDAGQDTVVRVALPPCINGTRLPLTRPGAQCRESYARMVDFQELFGNLDVALVMV